MEVSFFIILLLHRYNSGYDQVQVLGYCQLPVKKNCFFVEL